MGVGSRRAWQPRLAYITGSVDQELYLRQTTTPENTHMIRRFQADTDLHQMILHAVIRYEPTLDFQTAEAAGFVGVRDPEVLTFHGQVLELSEETYERLPVLAQQRQCTPEEMLHTFLVDYEQVHYYQANQQMLAQGILTSIPRPPCGQKRHLPR
jgi:hypothetical protein